MQPPCLGILSAMSQPQNAGTGHTCRHVSSHHRQRHAHMDMAMFVLGYQRKKKDWAGGRRVILKWPPGVVEAVCWC